MNDVSECGLCDLNPQVREARIAGVPRCLDTLISKWIWWQVNTRRQVAIRFDYGYDSWPRPWICNVKYWISYIAVKWSVCCEMENEHNVWTMGLKCGKYLTLTVTLTLTFEGEILNLLYLAKKISDFHETINEHIDWTLGSKFWVITEDYRDDFTEILGTLSSRLVVFSGIHQTYRHPMMQDPRTYVAVSDCFCYKLNCVVYSYLSHHVIYDLFIYYCCHTHSWK